ncbi:TonB-dependent receptor [Mucilaginibacter sp. SG564]|uniref:SusC/RagA family TonB-linked outer membrane protein n=1 Tax=Mucilaginibacter sp. SG564 TaxID=2587022 RepID=UPI001C12C9DB|nr:TonB-dependent receptor [Mucilaginibacter sp. SG564]NOW96406.1 TonB-linked SusC/RagA family outer membrane protein [Mucilaginibacter sp. SG564]
MKKTFTLSRPLGCYRQVRRLAFTLAPVGLMLSICQKTHATEHPTSAPEKQNTTYVAPIAFKISGVIYDENKKPLTGATITEKGTHNSTVSKTDGTFTISVPKMGSVLLVSYIGYDVQEVKVTSETKLVITLAAAMSKLSDVIVIGYGSQKKSSATVAASAVKGDVITKSPVPNISNALAGNVAGVSMRPASGRPGDDNPDIHIRGIATTGSNAPLVVIDGVIRNNINEVDPNVIASVTILKDAAAVAPYGLGGANGVILITTKRGLTGMPTLSLNSYYGIQSPTYRPNTLNAQDYMKLRNEAYLNENPGSATLPFAEGLIANYNNLHAKDPDRYPISDAKNQVPKKSSPMQEVNMQLSGGTKDVKYFAGLGYINQSGLFDPVNYRRYNYNLNLDVSATSTTTISLSLGGSTQNTNNVDAATTADNLYRGIYKFVPIAALIYSNGLPGEFAGNAPISILKAGYARRTTTNMLSTISVEQKLPFIDGLSIKGAFSYDPYNTVDKNWHTPYYYYSVNLTTTPYTYTKQISTAEGLAPSYTWLNQNYNQNNSFTYQAYLNYHHAFGKHDITGLVVAEEKNNKQLNFGATRNNYAIDIDELSLGSSDKNNFDNSGSSSTGSQLGYVYRVSYAYDNRYLLEASGRYDGHYYFAPGKRWGYFPAFSAGWVLSNEDFLAGNQTVNYLKIRGSWGKSGNLAGTAFQYLNAYNLSGNAYAFGNAGLVQGSSLQQEANPNITWEISTKTDIGFETTLWKGLLKLEGDVFMEKRTGMLLPPAITVPQEYGLDLAQQNAGIMKNHGFELTAGTSHQFLNGLILAISGSFSYAQNKMVQVFETAVTRNSPNRSRTGRPLNTMFGYHSLGIFKTSDDKNGDGIIDASDGYNVTQFGVLHPGDIRYADISGPNGAPDGKIDSYDETVIGHPMTPAITYGFTPSVTWKNVDLSLFFQGAALASYNVQGFQTVPFLNNNSNSAYEYYDNRWTPSNQGAKYPRATQSPYSNNTQGSDFWIVNTGYLRLKTAMLGYSLPSAFTKKIGMKKLRIYVSGQNIFTLSKLKFEDPEIGYNRDTNQSNEVAYPNQKVYVFGLNAAF